MTGFIKKEPVLSATFVLAIITCFLHVPQADVLQSIDFRVLAILFCLMTVTSGLDEEGILSAAASVLLSKAEKWRQVYTVLVFLCFFFVNDCYKRCFAYNFCACCHKNNIYGRAGKKAYKSNNNADYSG